MASAVAISVGLALFLSGVIGEVPGVTASRSGAQAPTATVTLLHGVPGRNVDVVVGGSVLIAGFAPGETRDLSAFAGRTLERVEVRAAGGSEVLIGPVDRLPVPASGDVTVVAHLRPDGTGALTPFVNQLTAPPAGQGRLTFRHLAVAPPVDLRSGGTTLARAIANPAEASIVLPAGKLSRLSVVVASTGAAIAIPELDLPEGANLVVHAVGSVAADNFTILTQVVRAGAANAGGGATTTAVPPTTAAGTPTTAAPGGTVAPAATPTTAAGPVTLPTVPTGATPTTVGTGATPTTVGTGATPTTVGTGAVPVPVRVDTGLGSLLPERGEGYPVGRVALLLGVVVVVFAMARVALDLRPAGRR